MKKQATTATEPRRLWIRVKETCVTGMSVFIAGQTYEVTDRQIEAIDKELNLRRLQLPKGCRSTIPAFQYEETCAPWEAAADPAASLHQNLQNTMWQLHAMQSCLESLVNQKTELEQQIEQTASAIDKLVADEIKYKHELDILEASVPEK